MLHCGFDIFAQPTEYMTKTNLRDRMAIVSPGSDHAKSAIAKIVSPGSDLAKSAIAKD